MGMGFWQWFTLITGFIGVVAFLMAIPSLLHIWGSPKIKVTFDYAQGYRLTCWIRNMPLNKFLLRFNVVRRQVEISTIISIHDKNNKPLHLLHYPPTQSDDIRLPIAEVTSPQNGKVYLKDENKKSTYETLGVGSYRLILELWWDGRELLRQEKYFRINSSKPFIE